MPKLSQKLCTQKALIIADYQHKRQPHSFFAAHTKLIRQTLSTLWQQCFSFNDNLCLLALGGFGRGELYPYSDIDLAIVSQEKLNKTQKERISHFIQTLWNYHLQPTVQIGSIEELQQLAYYDLSADTAFLESNFICGNPTFARILRTKLTNQRDIVQFVDAKILEQEQRHLKAQSSSSLLEPNIKTGLGGLRDIHTLIWLAHVQGLNPDFNNLVQKHILTAGEARLLLYSHKQLAKLRIDLHLVSKRAQEFFIFDVQSHIADQWALQDDEKQIKSEKLMQHLFHATKAISQLNEILLPILRARVYSPLPRVITQIDEQFYSVGNLLAIKDLTLFNQEPHYIFKIFTVLQKHTELSGIAPKTLRALWNQRKKVNKEFSQDPINQQQFIQFFTYGDQLTHTLKRLNLYGILGRYLPAFGKIVGLMQYDLLHIYPVDAHILTVVNNLRRFDIEAYSYESPQLHVLMQNFPYKHILYLAALFHDIAKGQQGSHSKLGAKEAKIFAQNHLLSPKETELLTWLVKEHLSFSITAQKEDIHNPQVIDRFCQKLQDTTHLTALYLLTVADIRGTNPKLLNSWRSSLLQALFDMSLQQLNQGKTQLHKLRNTRKQQAMLALTKIHISQEVQNKLCKTLGDTYFARHQNSEILWHTQKLIHQQEKNIVAARILPETQTMQVMIYTKDKPQLFAKLCQFLSLLNFNIIEAKVFTTTHNFALDTFILQQIEQETNQQTHLQLQKNLHQFLLQIQQPQTPNHQDKLPANKPSRRQRHFPIAPKITLIPQETPYLFTLEIVTADKQGLLAQIAQILAQFQIDILHAKISTLGERVEDSFLIYSKKLAQTKNQLALQNALLDTSNQ